MSKWKSYSLNLISDGKYILLASLIERLIYFIFYVYTARNFGQWVYGNIVSSFAFANILFSFFELGLNTYSHRFAASKKNDLNFIFNNIFSLKLLTIIPYFSFTFLYIEYQNNNEPYLTLLIALIVFLVGIGNFLQSLLFGQGKYKLNFYLILFSRFLFLFLFVISIYLEYPPSLILISFLIMALSYLFQQIIYLKKSDVELRIIKVHFPVIVKILRSSLLFGAGVIFVTIYDKIDIVIIQELLSTELVAVYAVAYSIYKLTQLGSSLLLVPSFTNLSSSFNRNGEFSIDQIVSILIPLSIIIMLSMIVFYFFGFELIGFLFGSSYFNSKAVLDVLLFAIPFLLLNNMTGVILNSAEKEFFPFITTFVGMIINIIACVILVLNMGLLGAALSTVIAEFIVFSLQFGFVIKLKLIK